MAVDVKVRRNGRRSVPRPGHARSGRALRRAAAAIGIDLAHLSASALKIAISESRHTLRVFLVGCGGTGSWLAPHLVRLARYLHETRTMKVVVSFIDPDVVELKNVFRQNFSEAEVGGRKAELLALRYSAAWARSVNVQAHTAPFGKAMVRLEYGDVGVIIGCVDNADARREISQTLQMDENKRGLARLPRLWWLDCGNGLDTGQVLLGSGRTARDLRYAFPYAGDQSICVNLPSPDLQHPELLERQNTPRPATTANPSVSCAELVLTGDQSPAINSAVANVAASYLWRMFAGAKGLTTFATYVNLEFHSVRSRFITEDDVADAMGKTRKWFRRVDARRDA